MSFDPNAFTLSLIQGLGQQIGQGRQQIQEQQVLEQLLPQLQQAQDPQQILNLITQAQGEQGLRPETRQQFQQAANPALKLATDNLKRKEELTKRQAKIETENDQKLGLAELIRQSGGQLSDEQAVRVPISALSSQLNKQLELAKQNKSKTFVTNSKFVNDSFEEERKSLDQKRIINQARGQADNFNQAAGFLGRAFPAAKGPPQAVFDTSVGLLIENFTKLFPGRISDVKFQFLKSLLPLASQSPDVRNAILDVLEDLASTGSIKADVLRSLQQQDPNILEDPNLQGRLNQELAIKFNEIDSKLDSLNQFQGGGQQLSEDEKRAALIRKLSGQG